jgi:hypothetical protein
MIGVCVPNGIASSITLSPNHCSARKQVAMRKHEGGIDIIVTCFWRWQFYLDAKGRGGNLIICIAGEPIASERTSASPIPHPDQHSQHH